MAIGIQLNLLRDISPHFMRKKFEYVPKPDYWHVLGSSDYLLFSGIDSFPSIEKSYEIDYSVHGPGGRTELNLLANPMGVNPNSRSRISDDIEFLKRPNSVQLFLVRMTISAVSLDQSASFSEVLNSIAAIEHKISNIGLVKDCSIYWSLGGTDLVAFIPTDFDREAEKLMQYVQTLRELRNIDVAGSLGTCKLHHVFASVIGTLASKANEPFSDGVRVDANSGKILLRSRISLAAGHESRAHKLQRGNATWGERSVEQTFESLAEFQEYRNSLFWKSIQIEGSPKTVRRTDVDSSRTDILFKYEQPSDISAIDHGEIELSNEANLLIEGIERSLELFSRDRLGRTQGSELQKIMNTLRHAVLRTERVGAIRDMLPFFRQLSKCFECPEWRDYYINDETAIEDTSDSLTILCNHLWRSIRNRIESRVENLDPSFPGSLDNGASKLVNAYSVVALICWEIFARNPNGEVEVMKSPNRFICRGENFAACVCSGQAGRVECYEAFENFRLFLENKLEHKITDRSEVHWNSNLLLLNISGPILFRPEAAIAHCLHEMAEFSDWSMKNWTKEVRDAVIKSMVCEVYGLLLQLLENSGAEVNEAYAALLNNILRVALAKLCDPENYFIEPLKPELHCIKECPHKISHKIFTALKRIASDGFWSGILECLEKNGLTANSTLLDELRRNLNSVLRDSVVPKDNQTEAVFDITQFCEGMYFIEDFLKECISDLGMVLGIAEIKRQIGATASKLSYADVNYCFGCMVESLYSWLRKCDETDSAVIKLICRWSVMHRAINASISHFDWQHVFMTDVKRYILLFLGELRVHSDEIIIERLVQEAMAQLAAYLLVESAPEDGKVVPGLSTAFAMVIKHRSYDSFLNITNLPDAQKALLSTMIKAWDLAADEARVSAEAGSLATESQELGELRSKLAFSLWAKSQKLAEQSLLVIG